MRLARVEATAALCALFLAGAPANGDAQVLVKNGTVTQGTLSFDGEATLGDFVGTTSTMSGQLTGGELKSVTGWVEAPVNTLKTGKGRRDRDLYQSMEVDKYPTMRFDLTGITPGSSAGDSMAVTLHGNLRIHGVSREVALPATLVVGPTDLHIHSDFPLDVEEYGVEDLSKMLGMLRMNSQIKVHVDLTFDQP